jgi:mannose-1-phosphate guanylyltransferase
MDLVSYHSNARHFWAVLLAGGDGTRLQSLTLKIAGDTRPRQFCRIFGDKSLLQQTRERIAPLFLPDRTMFVVTRAHEAFYRGDLAGVDYHRVVAQPRNRGTGVAIATTLLHLLRRDEDPLVAFFPCDHYYSDDDAFVRTVSSAMGFAQTYPQSIVLLGAEAHGPEIEYGWIEPGPLMQSAAGISLLRVKRFWEKPALPQSQSLLNRGCLWNTFVTLGRASTFLELLRMQAPDVLEEVAAGDGWDDLDAVYRRVRNLDFSREALAPMPQRLLVVRDAGSGWADLGNPTRVFDTFSSKLY